MIAGLLYVIGLITVLVSLVLVGYSVPNIIQTVTAAMDAGPVDYLALVSSIAMGLAWAAIPIVSGLLLMGFGRVIFLLGAINRSLRGTA